MSDAHTLVVEHQFDFPRDLVWRAWSETDLLSQWYGPGAETTIHKFEQKPGGLWLNEMRWGPRAVYARIEFLEVEPPVRLSWVDTASNAEWQAAEPMTPDWPQKHLHQLTLNAAGDTTNLRLTVSPKDASEAELATFAEKKNMMAGGWNMGFAEMETLFAELSEAAE